MIGSSHRRRAKSPLGTVLIINLLGKELTPRACMGDGDLALGNLRTTTKFTTTTSVDWERTGTRTSVSAGKRKLKMQSIDRTTTTTTLNVNKHVEVVQL